MASRGSSTTKESAKLKSGAKLKSNRKQKGPPGVAVTEKEFREFIDGGDPILKHIKVESEDVKEQITSADPSIPMAPSAAATFQNTYQLEPTKLFHPDKARNIIHSVMEEHVEDKEYDFNELPALITKLTQVMRDRVKTEMDLPRYKVVAMVVVVQKKNSIQGLRMVSRSIWNPETDNYADYTHVTRSLYIIGKIFVTYYE